MKLLLSSVLIMLTLTGCSEESVTKPDQCLRAELFQKCMQVLPAGPVSAHYNDWDEVVDSCGRHAYYTSHRKISMIKPECRS